MKAISCLPAATQMIHELGLEHFLSGVTFECPSDKPKVVRSVLEGEKLTSSEINEIVSQYVKEDKSLYYIEQELLEMIEPDIMFTQHVCDVCQVGTSYVEKAVYQLKKQPEIIPLIPKKLNDIFDNVITVAKALKSEQKGIELVQSYHQRINNIQNTLKQYKKQKTSVFFMEWINPIYNSGHWIPELVQLAGGEDELASPEGHSNPIQFDQIKKVDPEILIISPCGYDEKKAKQEVKQLEQLYGWKELKAVKNNKVYLLDANLFTQPSIGVVDGIELLASLFHPELFPEQNRRGIFSF
ncbi:ABC transporter substrate-binding protein [Chengkuizengella axinellae]|uniref:ABC transporter substrate-binding protein n=1 Tax=Chengkuizengella axinellae TaxID=3064388 RepID=A0ABT9IX19_9BACL|nr:ABC transporter substrate-binding protein [Chengkuizengella sp. 2205SS18-9]MDP5273919.1 ABC transporter substrate-binding protein [Chengkuizengella sp. 2205SS18-9]